MEIFCRQQCDYLVLEEVVYKKTSTSFENDRYVMYMSVALDERPFHFPAQGRPLGVEIREYREHSESPELLFAPFENLKSVFSYLSNDYLDIHGQEYERLDSELDQDRHMYVVYVRPTGVSL